MAKKDTEIDDYMDSLAPFAQLILKHLRELIHETCIDVEEKMQGGIPCFDYRGSSICSMAGYSKHCSLNFWKHSLLEDPNNLLGANYKKSGLTKGNLAKITDIKEMLSDKIITDFILRAMKLNEAGAKMPPAERYRGIKELEVPDYFQKEINKNFMAKRNFKKLDFLKRNNYVKWITQAKGEGTRNRRINDAVQWIAEGKNWNWKYLVKYNSN